MLVKVVVTRPAGQEEELVARLEALGHEVVHCPLIAIEPLGDEPIDVSGYDWVVVTSANGARELRRRMRGTPARVAAIGRRRPTAFGGADLVPAVSTQEGLLAELPRPAGRVLFAGAEGARTLLADELGADVVTLYRTRELPPPEPGRRPRRPRVGVGGAGLGRLGADDPGRVDRPRDDAGGAGGGRRACVREAATHDARRARRCVGGG